MHFLSNSKTLLLSALFSIVSISQVLSMELISAASVSSPEPVRLFSNRKDLFVEDENAAYRVDRHNMSPLLKEIMHRKAMGEFTEKGQGYLRVKQLSDGKYALEAKVRGDGGGFITGMIAGAVVRAVGYGTYGYSVVQTGGETILHGVEVVEAIEATANGAQLLGTAIIWLP